MNLVVRATRRPSTFVGKAIAGREAKGMRTDRGPGVRSAACRDRGREIGPEIPAFLSGSTGSKRVSSWVTPARGVLRA